MFNAQYPNLLINGYGMLMSNYYFLKFLQCVIQLRVSQEKKYMLMYTSFQKTPPDKANYRSVGIHYLLHKVCVKSNHDEVYTYYSMIYQNTNVVTTLVGFRKDYSKRHCLLN